MISATPVSTNFVHYGTRRIRIAKDGYETLTVEQPIPAPWYQIPPLNFLRSVIPVEIRDHRTLNYQLKAPAAWFRRTSCGRAEDLRACQYGEQRGSGKPSRSRSGGGNAGGGSPRFAAASGSRAGPPPPPIGRQPERPSLPEPGFGSTDAPAGDPAPQQCRGVPGPQTLPPGGTPLRPAGT